jgi:Protein of unknown function (DUF1580)
MRRLEFAAMHINDELFELSKLPLPRRPHVSTAWRWASAGVRGVKLRTTRIGGRVYVSRADFDNFMAALNAPEGERPQSKTVAARAAAAAAALEKVGA